MLTGMTLPTVDSLTATIRTTAHQVSSVEPSRNVLAMGDAPTPTSPMLQRQSTRHLLAESRSKLSTRQLSVRGSLSRQSVKLEESIASVIPIVYPPSVQAKLKDAHALAIMSFFAVLHGLSPSQVQGYLLSVFPDPESALGFVYEAVCFGLLLLAKPPFPASWVVLYAFLHKGLIKVRRSLDFVFICPVNVWFSAVGLGRSSPRV
jgi:hypothetical protein